MAALTGLMLLAAGALHPHYAQISGAQPWTSADVLHARNVVGGRAACVVDSEVGGVGYDPYAVSATHDRGPVQIHEGGAIERDYLAITPDVARQLGWRTPTPSVWAPWKTITYLRWMISHGFGANWRAIAEGWC